MFLWQVSCAHLGQRVALTLKTWEASKSYILEPFAKRGEMDQGILRFTWYSLCSSQRLPPRAAYRNTHRLSARPLPSIRRNLRSDHSDPAARFASRLAASRSGALSGAGKQASELGALFTIAICAMWPTVLNTAVGVRAIPQDYLNVARVLKLSRTQDTFQSLDSRRSPLHVYWLSTEPWHRLARDCCRGNADRPAGRRWISLAGV